MTGRIEIYLDVASMYSYVAFKQLQKTDPLLKAHGVEVDIKPVLLGGINAGSGNKPPWSLPAKAKYGAFDFDRSKDAVGLSEISPPRDLMAVSRTLLPLRALHYIKAHYPHQTYMITWHYLFHAFWGASPKRKVSDAAELAAVLSEIPSGFEGPGTGQRTAALFRAADVEGIMKATEEGRWKETLKSTVGEALERGAFGSPWLWVTNDKGQSEPFFGSDRWHFVYEFLGLPYQKTALLEPVEEPGFKSQLWSKPKL